MSKERVVCPFILVKEFGYPDMYKTPDRCNECDSIVINNWLTYIYCRLQYRHKNKYERCVGEELCPIVKR